MKNIVCTFVCLISFIIFNQICAQKIYEKGSGLLPDSVINYSDSIYYFYGVSVPKSGCDIIGKNLLFINDTIIYNTCLVYGNFGTPCGVLDTVFLLSDLDIGNYTFIHYSSVTFSDEDTLCLIEKSNLNRHDTAYYTLTVLPTTSLYSPTIEKVFHLQPNPSRGVTWIRWNNKKNQLDHVRILRADGALIESIIPDQTNNIKLDVSTWPSGIYFIEAS